FAGEQRDTTTGLDYLRARYLDVATGRFLSKDPFAGDMMTPITFHPYIYAGNNPISNVDPSGEFFNLIGLLIGSLSQNHVRASNVAQAGYQGCKLKTLVHT
ncbi:MAG: RHS repeat-associated core domain-containing protein, partial [Nitrospinaceae bacterium]|nr:RHS repeat-associated core domain-containing protein [Nitrospinaceae bacterium]